MDSSNIIACFIDLFSVQARLSSPVDEEHHDTNLACDLYGHGCVSDCMRSSLLNPAKAIVTGVYKYQERSVIQLGVCASLSRDLWVDLWKKAGWSGFTKI